jgi:hypothetical protein
MTEPIHVALTPHQLVEFQRLGRAEQEARAVLERIPMAREVAARAVILGQHAPEMLEGKVLRIDAANSCIVIADGPT